MSVVRRHHASSAGTGRLASWWPVLLSLLVVLVPTVCVLWFMTEAVENRRAVLRRSFADADLLVAQERLDSFWRDQVVALERTRDRAESEPAFFDQCVASKLADGLVCFDPTGQLIYPAAAQTPIAAEVESALDWTAIARLEYQQNEFEQAAAAYEKIAAAHGDPARPGFDANAAARAILGKARCLAKAGRVDEAIQDYAETLDQKHFHQAVDGDGRSIAAAGQLRALELIHNPADPRFLPVAERLSTRLKDYRDRTLAAPQRRFLMKRFQELAKASTVPEKTPEASAGELAVSLQKAADFPTLPAEELAAAFSEANPVPLKEVAVRATQSPGVWQLAVSGGRVVALFRTESVLCRSREAIAARPLNSGAQVLPVAPGTMTLADRPAPSAEAGKFLPGWRLEHCLSNGQSEPIEDSTTAAYFWTGILVIATMSICAAIIARSFRRQVRLTRLKNDLVATVSHELKTPLSSIRLLVDTLLDEPRFDQRRVREYLELVARENMRLTRTIDNFLAFSRMERNKHAFEFAETRVEDVVDSAVEVARQRHDQAGSRIHVEIAAGLPAVDADADALVTVLLNLLDNACKYSRDDAQIAVRAYAENGSVCLDVADHGLGLSKAAARKVFKPFYQVDRRVARETGGVGLGLSIVRFIVRAHGGTVGVRSRLGHGSTFTVAIPARSSDHTPEKEPSE